MPFVLTKWSDDFSSASVRGTAIEAYVRVFRGHYAVAAFAAGFMVYLIGLIIAVFIDFVPIYITSLPVYLGVFGIVWVTWWIAWATRKFEAVISDVQSVFLVSSDVYQAEVDRFARWSFDWRFQIKGSLLCWIAGWLVVYVMTRYGWLVWFAPEWSTQPNLVWKNLILVIYDLPIAFLLFISVSGIISYACLVSRISQLPLVPHIGLARAQMRGLADYGVSTSLAWSVGVSLFVLLFRIEFTLPAVVSVLLLTALGLLMFAVPQYAVHLCLERARRDIVGEALRRWKDPIGAVDAADWKLLLSRPTYPHGDVLDRLVHDAVNTSTWTYDFSDVASVMGTWLLPVLTLAANGAIT